MEIIRIMIGRLAEKTPGESCRSSPVQLARDVLFEHLQNFRWIGSFWFAHQQVHVLGHYYVSDEPESESRPDLIEVFDKAISRPRDAKQGPAAITAKGDEVKVAVSVVTPQRIAHESGVHVA